MNKRIREFADQALKECDAAKERGIDQYSKRFAELIVQECVKHITDQQDLVETNWQCKDGIHIVYSLKEHFGVEE